jgi:hypothetical protein
MSGRTRRVYDHGRFEIDADDVVNVVFGEVVIGASEFHAGVVDEDIDGAEFIFDVRDRGAPLLRVREGRGPA